MLRLWFDKGTILLKGTVGTPYGKWDSRLGCYRLKASRYCDALVYLRESGVHFQDDVMELPPVEQLRSDVELRGYQNKALENWRKAGDRGVLILPTAAGKTYIALKAISMLKVQTLIIVPTLDLIDQWRMRVKECLGVEAGVIGGGDCSVRMITVSTYDSAFSRY